MPISRLLPLLLAAALVALAACEAASRAAADTPALTRAGLVHADRAAWYEALAWPEECERSFVPVSDEDAGITIYPLAEKLALLEVVCLVSAYQRIQLYLTYDERVMPPRSRLLAFTTYSLQPGQVWEEESVTELTGLPAFDATKGELEIVTRFRGVGDCGSRARYGFPSGDPVLIEFLGKAECDGASHGWERIGP